MSSTVFEQASKQIQNLKKVATVKIQRNLKLKGKPAKNLANFPNSNTRENWSEIEEVSLTEFRDLILSGTTVRFGLVQPGKLALKGTNLFDLMGEQYGSYLDLDHLTQDQFKVIREDNLFKSAFMGNFSYSTVIDSDDIGCHYSFRYSRPLLVPDGEPQKIVKALYFYLENSYKAIMQGQKGKFDSQCFDPGRLKYGTKNNPENIFHFDESAILDVNFWLNYYEENRELLESKKVERSSEKQEPKSKLKESDTDLIIKTIKEMLPSLDWTDPNSFSPWKEQSFHQRKDQSRNGVVQFDGHDFKYSTEQYDIADSSKSLIISIDENGKILYHARSGNNARTTNEGNFLTFLADYYSTALSQEIDLDDRESRDFVISEYLNSFGLDFTDYQTKLKQTKASKRGLVEDQENKEERQQSLLNDDAQVNLSALDLGNPFYLHEVRKGLFVYEVNVILLAKIFLEYYKGRIAFDNVNESALYFYDPFFTKDCKLSYYWCKGTDRVLKSRLFSFCHHYYLSSENKNEERMLDKCWKINQDYIVKAIYSLFCSLPKINTISSVSTHFPFLNGLYDLKTKELVTYSPKLKNSFVFPFEFSDSKKLGALDFLRSFLTEFFIKPTNEEDHPKQIEYFIHLLACGMTFNGNRTKKYISLFGNSESGKSTFVSTFLFSLGNFETFLNDNASNSLMNIDLFRSMSAPSLLGGQNRFIGEIYRNLAIMACDETEYLTSDQMNQLKALTSPDQKIQIEQKNVKGFQSLLISALHIFLSENPLRFSHKDIGGSNRLVSIECQRVDTALWQKMEANFASEDFKQELICSLMQLDIFHFIDEIQTNGTQWLKERQENFRLENDPIVHFITDCIEITNDEEADFETSKVLTHMLWINATSSYKSLDARLLSRELNNKLRTLGYTLKPKKLSLKGIKVDGYPGLRFKGNFEEMEDSLNLMHPNFDQVRDIFCQRRYKKDGKLIQCNS